MRELSEIVGAYESLAAAGKPAALATVIGVEGSSYRRPGARMLVAEDGRTWGGVSGGCLERDVASRARGVMATGRPIICRYDTGDDETPSIGATTGCGGAVELFIQNLSPQSPGPVPLLARVLRSRLPVTFATVIRAAGSLAGSEGICLAISGETIDAGMTAHDMLQSEASIALRAGSDAARLPRMIDCQTSAGTAKLFVEHVLPPQAIVIFGAGPDAVPLANIARTLGWHTTVVGTRPAAHMPESFAMADVLCVTGSEDPTAGVELPSDCAVVVMTHNYARDRNILARVPENLRYLGILGPRHRTQRIMSELPPGTVAADIFSPVGLDIGAQTPEEIALSIVAEMQAVIHDAAGASLRNRPGPIHPRPPGAEDAVAGDAPRRVGTACAI